MDLTFLDKTEYIMEAWERNVVEDPNALILTDERQDHYPPERSHISKRTAAAGKS